MSAQPFFIPGAPAELLKIINDRRATIPRGMTMTAGPAEGAPAEQQGKPAEGKPAEGKPAEQQGKPAEQQGGKPADPPKDETPEQKIARLEATLASVRDDSARKRLNAKEQAAADRESEVTNRILQALGLGKDGEKVVNADELLAKLTAEQAKNKSLQMREAVRDAVSDATEAGRLLKNTDFLSAIEGLEPGDSTGIKKAVTDTLTANPWLKSAPGAQGKSGTDMSGGTGDGAKAKAATLEQAIQARYA